VREVLGRYGDCLIEQFVQGREFTVGVVGEKALPVLEIRPAQGFYDYRAKYVAEDTKYIFDSGLPTEQVLEMQKQALTAFGALKCRDWGRVDFIRDEGGRNYVLEVNTIPGFTDHSLVPKAAAHEGLSMAQLCNQIVQMAYDRPI
jgi:D-alanine-D-alanine ligase